MVKWISKIQWVEVVKVGGIYTFLAFLVRHIEGFLMMRYYQLPEYALTWSSRITPGQITYEHVISSLIVSFMTGISICVIYYYLKDSLPKKTTHRVFFFADVLVATSFIFFTLPVFFMFHVPAALLVSWFVSGFILATAASYLAVRFCR